MKTLHEYLREADTLIASLGLPPDSLKSIAYGLVNRHLIEETKPLDDELEAMPEDMSHEQEDRSMELYEQIAEINSRYQPLMEKLT